MLAPDDWPSWAKLLTMLLFGGLAGGLGAAAVELQKPRRELNAALVIKVAAGGFLGCGVFVIASRVTNDDLIAFGAGFVAGTLGLAAITDIFRAWLRSVLRLPENRGGNPDQPNG